MKFSVVGAGAIGRLFAGLLTNAKQEVVLVTRREEAALEIQRQGIKISDNTRTEIVRVKTTTQLDALRRSQIILFAVKSYDTAIVAQSIHSYLKQGATVMTLQNGLGNVQAIRAEVPDHRLIGGSTTIGARLLENHAVLWTGDGETVIGELDKPPSPQTKNLAATLSASGIPTSTTSNLKSTLWRKVLVNAGINPVTALLGITNGELLMSEEGWSIASRAVHEGLLVAAAERVRLHNDIIMEMREVAERTAKNRSSMLEDVDNHRQTEIDTINGEIVRIGRKHGIPTPTNEALWASIKSLETSNTHNIRHELLAGV